MAVLRAHDTGDIVAFRENADRQQQHVLEVDHPPLGLDLLVGLEKASHRGGVQIGRGATRATRGDGIRLGREHADLGPLDLGRKVSHGHAVELQAQS
jgi:hypothetical protein